MFNSPYNFVPLAPFVLYPEWAAQASHDHPFEDGLSGELAIKLINHTPLCVGGKQEEATEHAAGRVHFYRTPDNRLAIPGSSLKGMLRNALAPVVFARISQVEERKLSVRDISATDTYYHRNIVKQPATAGWLRFNDGQWEIRACNYVRIHQSDIIKHLKLDERAWKQAKTVKQRYQLLKGVRPLKFDTEPSKNLVKAVNLGAGKNLGSLVVTGQPGANFDQGKSAKKWEFVFFDAQETWYPVAQQAMRDFMFVHEDSEEWAFLRSLGHQQEEIPVFFHGAVSNIVSMGLASMYRLAQQNSLHDALGNISQQHLDPSKADLTELLFGRLQPENGGEHNWGLRGRVNIGLLQAEAEPNTSWTSDTVLSSPKPSFHPAYLQQEEGNYTTLDSKKPKLQGWKRYPVKPENVQIPPRLEDGRDISNKVKVRLETVENNSVFQGIIRFHNLRPVELGALLWSFDFGGWYELRHALGMGKPYGLGQIELIVQAEHSEVLPNNRSALAGLATSTVLNACQQVFIGYMNKVWQTAAETTNKNQDWEQSPQVRSLRQMADPQEGMRHDESLVYLIGPEPFLDVKKMKEYLRPYTTYEPVTWSSAVSAGISAEVTSDIEHALAQIDAKQQAAAEKAEREKARQSMKEGERILSEIAEQLTEGELTKTQLNNLPKSLLALENVNTEDMPSIEFAEPILQKLESQQNKRITNACKKVRGWISH